MNSINGTRKNMNRKGKMKTVKDTWIYKRLRKVPEILAWSLSVALWLAGLCIIEAAANYLGIFHHWAFYFGFILGAVLFYWCVEAFFLSRSIMVRERVWHFGKTRYHSYVMVEAFINALPADQLENLCKKPHLEPVHEG